MKTQFLFIVTFLLFTFSSDKSFAFAEENVRQKILIIIGYADDNQNLNIANFFQRPFYPEVANYSESSIVRKLLKKNYKKIDANYFKNGNGNEVYLYNANVICKEELKLRSPIMRATICEEQKRRSNEIIKLINSDELSTFTTIIYLGHARNGLGLGLGPFNPDYTVPLRFHNEIERGEIGTIFLASCNSQELYSYLNTREIKLIGTNEKLMWIKDLLPKVLTFLDRF